MRLINRHRFTNRHRFRSPHRPSGFTLVEILIVIAIIAILSMILFPVFHNVQERGRMTVCQSNLKQLGLAFQQYSNDAGGRYPFAGNFQAWKPGNGHWVAGECGDSGKLADISSPYAATGKAADVEDGAIYPYVKSAGVYVCPSIEDGDKKKLTYSMNCAISGMHTVRMKTPSEVVLLIDEDKANDGFFFAWDTDDAGSSGNSTDTFTRVHNGEGNMVFADGHAKAYPFKSFILDASATGKDNKGRMTGTPRFHDKAFGSPKGTAATGFPKDCDGTLNFSANACAQPIP